MDIKGHVFPFVVALAACMALFVLLDMAVMNMQGLSLIFHQ